MFTAHERFGPNVMRLSLAVSGEKLTGTIGGRPIEGTVRGTAIEFKEGKLTAKGSMEGADLKGEAAFPDRTVKWTAVRIPPRPASPRTHDFEPTEFHLYFSSKVAPALRIHPGDTVRTWSVDAGGRDQQGNQRSPGGNPQTGPFYIEGAMPNDTLVVRLNRVRTNRDWAGSGSTIMRTALEPGTLGNLKWDAGFTSRWKLDAGEERRVPREADRGARRTSRSRCSRCWVRGRGAARRLVGSHHRFGPLRREHGLQPDPRGNDRVSAGLHIRARCCFSATAMLRRATEN